MRSSPDLEKAGAVEVPATGVQLGEQERAAVERVLSSGMLTQGPEVASFESRVRRARRGRPCVAVNSGTSALLLALLALGIGPGDEVIVPSFSFAATANAVALAGARPVFVDIEPHHFCLDPDAVRAAITRRTSADHTGSPVRPSGSDGPILDIAARHALAVVEDAAQAHLAAWTGSPSGPSAPPRRLASTRPRT